MATATINPTRLLADDTHQARIEQGQAADLVLLRANPLQDISAMQEIEAVIRGGQLYGRAALDALQDEAAQAGEHIAAPAMP